MGSYEINTRDESGTFVKSVFNESVYIAKDEHLLEDVVVYGKYPRGDNNYYEISGSYPYTEYDMPSGSFYGEDTNDLSGNYLAMFETSGLGSGGGSTGGGYSQRHKRIIADARGAIPKFIGYNPDDKSGCLRRCLDMLGYSNNRISPIRNVQMVTKGDNGTAGEHTVEYQEGLNLLNTLLAQKRPVVVGIDYSNIPSDGTINEGITDHFVVIVSRESRLIDGKEAEVYRYYDPITKHASKGTHEDNYLYVRDNKLIGVYKHHPSGSLNYTVTQVREYKR